MEFTTYYPTTKQAESPTSPRSLLYSSSPSDSLSSCPRPSESSAPLLAEDGVYSPVDALLDGVRSVPAVDPLDRFMTAKKRFLARSTQDILGLIYERETLKYENIRRMLYESAHIGGQLRNLGDWTIGSFKDIDKTRSQLEKEIAGLEKERRGEEVSAWRDIIRLKTDLREVLKEFNHEKEKEGLLSAYNP